MIKQDILDSCEKLSKRISELDFEQKVEVINELKSMLHEISPFKNEPVDCVLWVKNDLVIANDYNPNKVAPLQLHNREVFEVIRVEDKKLIIKSRTSGINKEVKKEDKKVIFLRSVE